MPNINEFSYDGAAGEFVEIRVAAGEDVSGLELEIYGKSGPSAELDQVLAVGSGTFTTDGTYDYYVLSVALEDGPRAAIALVNNGTLIESVTWGATSPVTVLGGALDGTTQASIGDPLKNNSTDSLITDGNGGWILTPPTVGEENICLTAGTLIKTTDGEIPIEELRTGMQVTAYEGGARAIRWIGHRHFDEVALRKQPKLRPVRILAGAMGNELPKRDLLVSRQHRLLVRSKIAERMFGVPEVLISAIKMTKLAGIFVDETAKSVDYFHLLFDRHEVIFAEGMPTESLFTGPETLTAIGAEAREEILAILPEVAQLNYAPYPAAPIPSGKLQKQLVSRHLRNAKPVFA
ncbi:Hint domain-containing protein [Boseongicola aestuarii]|uniref:Hedgehog/Intein (Hint) domain-containing protein n=1 Tax=Boseongicola aestuarii TaxID=1470561 RepID=A0A238J230_9RHOB|nr:Hint domain-containing protein [Boseongicola aestuarii]SMX24272.1 hypothetical protein BOA8489_02395 [Boseongicola aestuarii]